MLNSIENQFFNSTLMTKELIIPVHRIYISNKVSMSLAQTTGW